MENDTVTQDTLVVLHRVRGFVYHFMYTSFLNVPGDEYYKEMVVALPDLKTFSLNADNEDMVNAIQGLEDFFNKRDKLNKEELSEFDLDALRKYTSIFCLGNSVQADESYYTSNDNLLRQESYDKIMELFRKYNFALGEGVCESEEHISMELAFMSKLSFMSVEKLEMGNISDYNNLVREQLDFHINHLDKWVYDFCENVINYPIENEYVFNNLVIFLRGFLKEDKMLLAELVGD